MIYLYIFFALIAILLIYTHICTRFPKVSQIGEPGEGKLKIIQLSDIHISMMYISYKRLAKIFNREKPDMFFITGDLIAKKSDIKKADVFIKFVQDFAPVVFCMGNHDYKAYNKNRKEIAPYTEHLLKMGVSVLQNSSFPTTKGNRNFRIIGIDEIRYHFHDIKKVFSYTPCQDEITLVLCHNPDVVLQLGSINKKIDMLFTGHFHGGQIWLFGLEYTMLRKEKICRMGMRRGLHNYRGIPFYINRGLGNVTLPLRFLASPEIAIFYF